MNHQGLRSRGIFMGAVKDFNSNPLFLYVNPEAELNTVGYELLGARNGAAALEVFRLNVDAFPSSANVYDSLGEAYMATGEKELAIKNYERSLELNPRNGNARFMVTRLREQQH